MDVMFVMLFNGKISELFLKVAFDEEVMVASGYA